MEDSWARVHEDLQCLRRYEREASMVEAKGGEEAVAKRLGPMCVVQFKLDGQKVQKLKGLKETGTWEQTEYVKKQGWATMPGEKEADSKVADECVKLLMQMS